MNNFIKNIATTITRSSAQQVTHARQRRLTLLSEGSKLGGTVKFTAATD